MGDMIQSWDELRQYFIEGSNTLHRPISEGVFVSSKVRREALCSQEQGKITLRGKIQQVEFEGLGGGVWRARLMPYIRPMLID